MATKPKQPGTAIDKAIGAARKTPNPRDRDAFARWLDTKPPSWLAVIAARAALRVLPMVRSKNVSARMGETQILPIFLSTALARFSVIHRDHPRISAARATSSAIEAIADFDGRPTTVDENAASAAANALWVAMRPYNPEDDPPGGIAADAAFDACAAEAASATAILHDAQGLDAGRWTPEQLGRVGLWTGEDIYMPDNIRRAWIALSDDLHTLGHHWRVWTEWYEAVLSGSPPAPFRNEDWEVAFTEVDEPLPWDDLAPAVNTTIADRLKKLLGESSAIPPQVSAPVRVEERDGKVAQAPNSDSPLRAAERDFDDWRAPVIDHIGELTSTDFRQGTNHSRARDRLVALGELLPGEIAVVKDRQFRIGYEIERLERLITAYRTGGDDMPALNPAALEDLAGLLVALKMGVDKLERWAEFRRRAADDPAREGSAEPAAVVEALEQIADEMERKPAYFDPQLPASFRFLAEAVKDPVGATKVIIYGAVKSAENLLAFLGQKALAIGRNAIEGIERAISPTVAASLLLGLSHAALQLSSALPQGLAWLKPLLETVSKKLGGG